MKKRVICMFLIMIMLVGDMSFRINVSAVVPESVGISDTAESKISFPCRSAFLMEANTGTVLFEQNPDEALHPASVTKIMTLLLVMEAMERGELALTDTVTASAHASSMGGSQIFLKEGEQMSVEDLLKSVVIASANDAAVALAEHLSGTEEAFVSQMNQRAAELGMRSTHFENTNGLDDTTTNHLTSARDIALMSRELLKHETITSYSSIWMDSIRDGAFGLTNTNRLVRFYKGATGLKTGSTSKAGFCISATAMRDGMHLICVIMGAESRDLRNAAATSLLDWGFANYCLYEAPSADIGSVRVTGGVRSDCEVEIEPFFAVLPKTQKGKVTITKELPASVAAPISKAQTLGKITYRLESTELGSVPVLSKNEIEKISFWELFWRVLERLATM